MQPRILYIDDNKSAHDIFNHYAKLIIGDVSVISAFDGEEGICKHSNSDMIFDPIHLVVTDYTLPVKNGQEVIRAIREVDTTIPIYVSSVHSLDALRKMEITGANGLLSKPFNKKELEVILRATIKPTQ